MAEMQKFTPGVYLDWEKDEVQLRLDQAAGKVPAGGMGGFRMPDPKPYTFEEIYEYNHKWDPFNPLFNDRDYAIKAGYKGLPAMPGFAGMAGAGVQGFPKDIASKFFYTNDGTDIYLYKPVVEGDFLKRGESKTDFREVTEPGSTVRAWFMGGEGTMVDEAGNVVIKAIGNTRDCYSKFIDGTPDLTYTENMSAWYDYFPPMHYTTDDEWDYIRELWKKEEIRGGDKLYWEDVQVGTFMPETCSGPIGYMEMIALYGNRMGFTREQLSDPKFLKTQFRDASGNYLFETAIHLGTRNWPNGRMVWYNDTGARHIMRTVTNYIGDAGYVSRFCWRFYPFFKEMRTSFVPLDYDLITRVVPGYENRPLNRHGSEGDTCIGKAYIYNKRIDELGRHVIDICAWGETLDGDIVQVCPMAAVLPSRGE